MFRFVFICCRRCCKHHINERRLRLRYIKRSESIFIVYNVDVSCISYDKSNFIYLSDPPIRWWGLLFVVVFVVVVVRLITLMREKKKWMCTKATNLHSVNKHKRRHRRRYSIWFNPFLPSSSSFSPVSSSSRPPFSIDGDSTK